jgi:hypothetical protein
VSFDVFLSRFDKGELAAAPRQPVREVLGATAYRGPDQFGFYVVTFPDGVHVEFSARGLESEGDFTGCAFHIRGFGNHLIKFMLEVARAGNMVMMPAMEGNPLILVSEDQKADVPPEALEHLRPVVVNSSNELEAVLTGGFEGWSAYRNQVVREPTAGGEA